MWGMARPPSNMWSWIGVQDLLDDLTIAPFLLLADSTLDIDTSVDDAVVRVLDTPIENGAIDGNLVLIELAVAKSPSVIIMI
jgi:hypothetical protein